MFRILDKRGTGKTGRLMLLAKEQNATIVCSNPHAMREKAHAYGIVGLDFISYGAYICNREGGKKYLIDELDEYLKIQNIIGYTVSMED